MSIASRLAERERACEKAAVPVFTDALDGSPANAAANIRAL